MSKRWQLGRFSTLLSAAPSPLVSTLRLASLDLLLKAALGRAKPLLVVASKPAAFVLLANAACRKSLQHEPKLLMEFGRQNGVE